jgi:hypothetical protein
MKHLKEYELYERAMGDCYPAGGRLIMNFFGDKDHRLVHGMVDGQGALEGMRYGHCWVESKDTVLDHSNGKKLEIPTKVYYALGRVDPAECKYYSPKEAARFMSEEEHWGPWEMSGDPVSINEDIPDDQKEIGKREIKIKNKDMKTMKSFEDFNTKSNENKVIEGYKSNIKKKWDSTDIMMDDLREFILDAADSGGVDLVMDIADSLKLMTNYALGEHKKLK